MQFDTLADWATIAAAAGGVVAAVAAWKAATHAKDSAAESNRLVEVESARDAAARADQAKRVVVDMGYESMFDAEGRQGAYDVHLVVTNGSDAPIMNVRVQIGTGDNAWGPQPIGTVLAGTSVHVRTRIVGELAGQGATVRYRDLDRVAWVGRPSRPPERDTATDDDWIERGQQWVQRAQGLSEWERGHVSGGSELHDFDHWRDSTQLLDSAHLSQDEINTIVERMRWRRIMGHFLSDRSLGVP